MPIPNSRFLWLGDRRLAILVILLAHPWVVGVGQAAEPDLTKKPFTFPNPIQRKLGKQEAGPASGKIELMVELVLPKGWKLNAESPVVYYVDVKGKKGPLDRSKIRRQHKVSGGKAKFAIPIWVGKGGGEPRSIEALEVTLNYFICQGAGEQGEGVCRAGSVIWTFPLQLKAGSEKRRIPLTVKVPVS